jgi:glycosyltransferase involved in cell wall biosynthesis
VTPELSIVIPTHNRRDLLPRTLRALAHQTVPSDVYEVILVADGCQDDTANIVRSLDLPYTFHFIEQATSGAAAARNRGASAASAPLILFLDDDMEASTELVAAHLEAHRRQPSGVVLGYFSPARHERSDDVLIASVNLWWGERFFELSKESHRFTFQDLFAGNVSLPRELFNSVGKFDERFYGKAGEDYELAARLLKRRVRFQFVREAASIHHDMPSPDRSFERAVADGRGHILFVQKHPETFTALPLYGAVEGGPQVKIGPWFFHLRPWMTVMFPKALSPPLKMARVLKARRLGKKILGLIYTCGYWQGVLSELGSSSELRGFIQDLPIKLTGVVEFELDLATELDQLDAILNANHVDALRLCAGSIPIGRIAPILGAEALRPIHVRHSVIHWYAWTFLTALIRGRVDISSNMKSSLISQLASLIHAGSEPRASSTAETE